MNNPKITIQTQTTISSVELFRNQYFNVFAGGMLGNNLNNVEISFDENGVLLICARKEFIDNIKVATYDEVYG